MTQPDDYNEPNITEPLPCKRRHPRTDKPLCEALTDLAVAGVDQTAVMAMSERCCDGCNGDGTYGE